MNFFNVVVGVGAGHCGEHALRSSEQLSGEFHGDDENDRDRAASFYRACWVLLGALRLGRSA